MRLAAVTMLALLMGGCSTLIFPTPEPAAFYRLEPPAPAPLSAPPAAAPVSVLVPRPEAPRALAGDQIVIKQPDGTLAYAANVRWVDPIPGLIQDATVSAFEEGPSWLRAARPRDGVAPAYELALEVRRFEAAYRSGADAAPTVDVAISARLVRTRGRELVAVSRFDAERRSGGNRTGAIVDAFNSAMGEVNGALLEWAAAEIAQAGPSAAEASR